MRPNEKHHRNALRELSLMHVKTAKGAFLGLGRPANSCSSTGASLLMENKAQKGAQKEASVVMAAGDATNPEGLRATERMEQVP